MFADGFPHKELLGHPGSIKPVLRITTPPLFMINNSSNHHVAFPKPPTQASRRRAKRKAKNDRIASVRSAVMNRDGYCRVCHERGSLHMHEVVFRSAGRSVEDTFNLINCLALCARCHQQVHARKVWLSFVDQALGCNGRVVVTKERRL